MRRLRCLVGERRTTAALLDGRELNDGCPACWGNDGYDTGWEKGGRRLPCWVRRRLRCLEGESWMTAALLGWTTFMILDGKGMASRVEERRATAALLGGRVSWTTAALLDGRELDDGCPVWIGES